MSGPPTDAAAMDALNLDDLFLGGGDDDPQGGMADSLFADMDIDLGDIMDGIIGDDAAVGGGGGGLGDDPMGNLFGSGGLSSDGGGGGGRDSTASYTPPLNDNNSLTSSNTRGKARTARSNPHLVMAQQQKQMKAKQSAVANEARSLSSSMNPQILSPTAKRKRRKSKKASSMDEDDDFLIDSATAPGGHASSILNVTKKTKRNSSSGRHRSKLSTGSSTTLDGSIQGNSTNVSTSILPQSLHELKMEHDHQQQASHSSLAQCQSSSQSSLASQPPQPSLEEIQRSRQKKLQAAQESISKYGIGPSSALFFPYMHLPAEVDVKKRGHKAYPLLEKLNIQSSVSHPNTSDVAAASNKEGEAGSLPSSQLGSISASSSIYKLFDEHIGALTDNHGTPHPAASLQSSLLTSVQQASSYIKPKKKKKHHQQHQSQQQQQQSPHHQHLIGELSKLYLGCMKQSFFLRQNLWNMERWCEKHFNKEDFNGALGSVKRRDIEWVIRMMQKEKEMEQKEELRSMERSMERKARQVQLDKAKIVNTNKTELPTPENSIPNAPTHGGPKSTPLIAIKVRVKVSGWRDKSGTKLTARLWSPSGWKVAVKRANNLMAMEAAAASGPRDGATTMPITMASLSGGVGSDSATTKLDFSSVDRTIMEAVASELVRPDLRPTPKKVDKPPTPPPPPVAVKKSSITMTTTAPLASSSSAKSSTTPSSATAAAAAASATNSISDSATATITSKESKAKTRKRKAKEIGSGASSTAKTASSSIASSHTTATAKSSSNRDAKQRHQHHHHLIPHISSCNKPRFHPAILAPFVDGDSGSTTATTNIKPTTTTGINVGIHNQHHDRLIQFLYTQILHPSLSPTERRQLLANEISSTLQKLETARSLKHIPKMHTLTKQIEELQAIYEEDTEIVPENSNTIGMWNWIKRNSYFDEVARVEDVYDGLEGCWQPDLKDFVNDDGCWGTLVLPPVKVLEQNNTVVEGEGLADGGGNNSSGAEEASPLFDRLQSLLVEVDDDDENYQDKDSEDEEDDDLLSSLPSFSPEEFIFGPNKNSSPNKTLDDDDTPDDAMLDVSALTLDQRTFIQLRAAGLVDKNTTPFFPRPPSTYLNGNCNSIPSSSMSPSSNVGVGESIESILSKMKSQLSTLHVQNNIDVANLQRKALSHVISKQQRHSPNGGKIISKLDEETILSKYKQSIKLQKEQKEEKLQKIRTSGRVKTGSNKFDGGQWLPW